MSEYNKEKAMEDFVKKMQENIKDIWRPYFHETSYINKWLTARDYDLKKAENMLRSHIAWREREKIDTILDDFKIPEVYEKYGFGGYCGHDKEGRPVSYEAYGRSDPQGLLKSVSSTDIIRARIYMIEQLFRNIFPQRSKQEGHEVNQIVVIFDLEGFGKKHLWKPVMECLIEALKIMEANYPEYMNKILIFNSPPIFKIAFNMIKFFLHQATRNKISFLGKNYKEELLRLIDKDQLPAFYGGNMYGPNNDPTCAHLIRWGGEVPYSFYMNTNTLEIINVTINPRSKVKLLYHVTHQDSVLFYEFSTKDHDINFGIYYIGEDLVTEIENTKRSDCEEILNLHRKHSDLMIQKGEVDSLRKGYYLIEFDNSYSWVRPKHVQYNIEILDVIK